MGLFKFLMFHGFISIDILLLELIYYTFIKIFFIGAQFLDMLSNINHRYIYLESHLGLIQKCLGFTHQRLYAAMQI